VSETLDKERKSDSDMSSSVGVASILGSVWLGCGCEKSCCRLSAVKKPLCDMSCEKKQKVFWFEQL
jgi:hypothetical protein